MKNYRLFCRIVVQSKLPSNLLDGIFADFVPRGTILAEITQRTMNKSDVPRGTFRIIFEQYKR